MNDPPERSFREDLVVDLIGPAVRGKDAHHTAYESRQPTEWGDHGEEQPSS